MTESIARGHGSQELLDETIGANLARSVASSPDGDALVSVHQGLRLTYREFAAAVGEVARGLLALGIERGDRVGIWSPNCAEWVLVQYGTAEIGAILVTVNPAYRAFELEYVLRQSGVSVLVAAESFLDGDYRTLLTEVAPGLPLLRHVSYLGTADWDGLLRGGAAVDPSAVATSAAQLRPGDPINIQYTSGTTGFPKGATLSHRNILNNGYFVGEACGYTSADRVCIPVPLYHCFGMVMGNLACTSHGACMVLPYRGFNAAATLDACAGERSTSLYGVPTIFIAELADPQLAERDLSSLRTEIMAGAPCPVEVMKQVMTRLNMAEVTIAYGMTETSPVSVQTSRNDALERRVSTVGTVHPHLEVKIVDPAGGEAVARGERGELCTRGYSVMLGYWDEPERTAEVIDADGWLHSGDLATMDSDGYVKIVGRIKDMIVRGGENVYPREVEECLHRHPAVQDAGDRRPRRPPRRKGDGLDPAPRRRAGRRGGDQGVLPRPHRPLQGSPLHPLRRRLPDDRHRQDPEVQDARAGDPRPRPRGRGGDRDGVTRGDQPCIGTLTARTAVSPASVILTVSFCPSGIFTLLP